MAAFDPNKFLAETAPAQKKQQGPAFDPNKFLEETTPIPAEDPGTLHDLFVAGTEGLLMGARPFVAGVGGAIGAALGERERADIEGQGGLSEMIKRLPGAMAEGFRTQRAEAQQEIAETRERRPGMALATELGTGIIAGGPIAKGLGLAAKGATATQRIASGAKAGATFGTTQALGHANDPLEAAINVGGGTVLGGGVSAVAEGVPLLLNWAGKKATDLAEKTAFKAAGPSKKDLKIIDQKGNINKFGRFLLDRGLVKAGDTVDDVAAKAQKLINETGDDLDRIYERARVAGESIKDIGLDLDRDRGRILTAARKAVQDKADGPAAIKKLEDHLDLLASNRKSYWSTEGLSPRQSNDIKTILSEEVNYARDVFKGNPTVELAYDAARKEVSDIVDKTIEAGGGGALLKELKEANLRYGYAKEAYRMAQAKLSGDAANRFISLTDYITGGGLGAATTMATGGVTGLAAGLGGALANRALRRYGAPVIATGLERAGQALTKVPTAALPGGMATGLFTPARVGTSYLQTPPESAIDRRLKNKYQEGR